MLSQNIGHALFAMMVFASQGTSYAAALVPAVPALPAVDAPAAVPVFTVLGLADHTAKLAETLDLPVPVGAAAAHAAAP